MWKATRITADAASKMQIEAGILLTSFNVANPVEPADANILCSTTGDFSITCVPQTQNFFDDVNNITGRFKEGERITGWDCGLTVTSLDTTADIIKFALGAADVGTDGGINPRSQYVDTDFKDGLTWIADMVDDTKLLAVVMDNSISTGGVNLTTGKNKKGNLALTITPLKSLANTEKCPMAFYELKKVATTTTTP